MAQKMSLKGVKITVSKTGNFLDPPTQFFADVIYGWFLMLYVFLVDTN